MSRSYTFGSSGTSIGQFYKKHLEGITLNNEGVDWGARDLTYLKRDEYESRFQRWLSEASPVPDVNSARNAARDGRTSGDLKVLYRDKTHLIAMCKALGLMEDLKAGVPRTAYHGVILIRMSGRRVFLAPAYRVDQDVTVK